MWEIVTTEGFSTRFDSLDEDQQDALIARVDLLAEHGPALGRPIVDSIRGARHHNVKELRASKGGALRVLFAFDPLRQAVLLVGGNKSGLWDTWYGRSIPLADDLYDEYLNDLRDKGIAP